ncbi:hypothetical protein BJ165DRAFT_1439979 [Panaeolus papilionaceus]|nr:hypothetical protein BJ165DRAFT_1439979 [Panaeolus papilionaceus]
MSDSSTPDVVQHIKDAVAALGLPDQFSPSEFALQCVAWTHDVDQSSPTLSDSSRLSGEETQVTDKTSVTPQISDYERCTYYTGLTTSNGHPDLLYRTGSSKAPWTQPTGNFEIQPTKSFSVVCGMPINKVWRTVGPQINRIVKDTIKKEYTIDLTRFIITDTTEPQHKKTLGPVVIWIGVAPGSTSADTARNVSADIQSILKISDIVDVEVEWHEAVTQKLIRSMGPNLLPVSHSLHTTVDHRRHLTATLGIPISTAEKEGRDQEGTMGFFFHEAVDLQGHPSEKVFGVSTRHVLRDKSETHHLYEFKGASAPRQYVQVAGFHRFQAGLDAIKKDISDRTIIASTIAKDSAQLTTVNATDLDPEDNTLANDSKTMADFLSTQNVAIQELEKFHCLLMSQWSDISQRNIGHVHYSPPISVVGEGLERFTEDWGTVELFSEKFKKHFAGNVIDLGTKLSPAELTNMLNPIKDGSPSFEYPPNRQFRIRGFVSQEELFQLHVSNSRNDHSDFIVLKDGCATGLTLGRYTGLESFRCDENGCESIELAIYNYDDLKKGEEFSKKGDSGSLVVDSRGRMVGLLHSGKTRGPHSTTTFVTYLIPAWWIIDRIKTKYPHADFNQTS